MATQADARKHSVSGDDVLKQLDGIEKLYVAKGKQQVVFDLKKDRPSDEDLVSAMTGPTGNLRAPTLRKGKHLVVGFSEDLYRDVL